MTLVARFTSTIAQLRLAPGRAIVAVSGGVDSIVLLELLVRSRAVHQQELIVAHVDHGLQPVEVPRDIVEQACARHQLTLVTRRLDLPLDGTETDAREARLRALRDLAEEHGGQYIVLAHHADDQAETVLMRVTRGTGAAGLRGIARRRGKLLRPLLGIRREELVAFAVAERLRWWEDPANRDPRHLRSWFRTEVMPQIAQRLPDLTPRLLQVAAHARRERAAWRQLLSSWPELGWNGQSVSLRPLREMPAALRVAVLGAMAREQGCPAGPTRLAAGWQSLERASSGQRAALGGGWQFEIAFDQLRLLAPDPRAAGATVLLEAAAGSMEWGEWRVQWLTEAAPDGQPRAASVAWFVPGPLLVRPWRPGDRLRPLGGTGRRLAVRCFQDARVPGSSRAGWPVLENRGDIAWIPGVCRSDLLIPVPGTSSLRVEVSALG